MKKYLPLFTLFIISMITVLCAGLIGCQPIERTARDVIVASSGFLDVAITNHDAECRAFFKDGTDTGKSAFVCPAIVKAVAVHNLLVDALNLYCAGPIYDTGGACTPNKELRPKLEAALRDLSAVTAEVKAVLK